MIMQSIIGRCHGAGAFALCVYRFGVSDLVGTRLMSSQIRSYVSDEFMLVVLYMGPPLNVITLISLTLAVHVLEVLLHPPDLLQISYLTWFCV